MRKAHLLAICGAVVLAGGCTGVDATHSKIGNYNSIHALERDLGIPESVQDQGDRKVYVWGHSDTLSMPTTDTNTTTGTVYGSGGTASFTATTYDTDTTQIEATCLIKVEADSQGDIRRWQVRGNQCSSYADRLSQ